MQQEQIVDVLVNLLEDEKASQIAVYDQPNAWIKCGVICTANSTRHLATISETLRHAKINGQKMLVETGSEWVVASLGVVGLADGGNNYVVHIFTPECRDYYLLDDLWHVRIQGEESDN